MPKWTAIWSNICWISMSSSLSRKILNFRISKEFFYFLSPEIVTSFFLVVLSSCLVLASSSTSLYMAESKALVGRSAEYKKSIVLFSFTEIKWIRIREFVIILTVIGYSRLSHLQWTSLYIYMAYLFQDNC